MAIKRFTVKEVEDAARLLLLDTDENAYRFEPKEMHAAMVDALERIRLERPASRYVGGILADLSFIQITDGGQGRIRTCRMAGVRAAVHVRRRPHRLPQGHGVETSPRGRGFEHLPLLTGAPPGLESPGGTGGNPRAERGPRVFLSYGCNGVPAGYPIRPEHGRQCAHARALPPGSDSSCKDRTAPLPRTG